MQDNDARFHIQFKIRELLLNLDDDETRLEVIRHAGICLHCGTNLRVLPDGCCYCTRDE